LIYFEFNVLRLVGGDKAFHFRKSVYQFIAPHHVRETGKPSAGTRTFKPGTPGAELVSDLKIVSKNIFTKCKGNALTSEEFAAFISKNEICDFYIAGADAVACVKSTCYNLCKANYGVHVLSDCITSYDKRKIDEMLHYYESKGSKIITLNDLLN